MSRRITLRHLRKVAAGAVVAVAAFGLTACQDNADAGEGTSSSASASASDSGSSDSGTSGTSGSSDSDSAGSSDSSGGSDTSGGSGSCKTSQLAFSSSHGMGEGDLIVNLKNTGSAACTLQGFPGVDLKSKNGTVSATRSTLDAPKVSVAPNEETRFTLHYPPNDSGGSGETFTTLVVTPPNETHSTSLSVSINVPVTDETTSSIKVDPVGTGK
ncbi:DUF4232 domain-containing protein [Streptomyces sp. S465]|uniref:DUF4232 domain-containing protein n=1 Tax=Streptomyces sp. S465 TaxID=2979468 RepID=UPI0022A8CC88|nr:DUF4232 domain-containing protein [Streptomyces sp. S465]WAP57254.1 DUF4232 domain-containing protein [Streptomyces sp. S465]